MGSESGVVLRWDQEGEGYRKWVSMKWVWEGSNESQGGVYQIKGLPATGPLTEKNATFNSGAL